MKPAVVLYKSLSDDLRQRLNAFFDVTEIPGLDEENVKKYASVLQKAHGIIGSGGKFDQKMLDRLPQLKVASTISAGYDKYDVDALNARGILLMHTPSALTDTVADLLMGLVLATARRLPELAQRTRVGEWRDNVCADWFGSDVHHKTLGVVGMGRIGMALAQRAHLGFSMPILYNARHQHSEAEQRFNATYCDLDSLMAKADFVCIILPLTDQTHHLINRERLANMKPSAILINAGRGPVVDEVALIEALENHTISAAGLDVFEQEPLATDSPLLQLPNVVALPHIGSATHETRYAMDATAVDNLIAAFNGQVQENCVNPQVANSSGAGGEF
ncbi:glyoxylate/hydroxypyruvate reductase GhrB [Acerihabitans sp. TG2]|uniref:glyoxylate/hydroxypyruvate reductase GhrB n=1 Tax=Acerihabitans sp. TG2 TaxID=3096008 RepID=UPI002B23242D|nr:glyoxylate/hydroxypyruvate reductase GhrB [Acerihabitans sp. TG2]MEA9389972.1 glyoxylate/hydroxypyruvate reductase GhrB [Acerihabitans sp. TG2]